MKFKYPSAYESRLNKSPLIFPRSAKTFIHLHSPPPHPRVVHKETHLLAINTPIIRLNDDEALARDVQPSALDLLHIAGVLVRGDDLLHFGGRDGEASAGRPNAVALVVEDGGAVDVAGADEAVGGGSVSQGCVWLVVEGIA